MFNILPSNNNSVTYNYFLSKYRKWRNQPQNDDLNRVHDLAAIELARVTQQNDCPQIFDSVQPTRMILKDQKSFIKGTNLFFCQKSEGYSAFTFSRYFQSESEGNNIIFLRQSFFH